MLIIAMKGEDKSMKKYLFAVLLIIIMLVSTSVVFAETDSNVVVVNPEQYSTTYSDSLLISVKILEPKTIRVAFYEEKQVIGDVAVPINVNEFEDQSDLSELTNLSSELVYERETFVSYNKLSFYTKRVEGITPGLYRIKVDTIESSGNVIFTSNTHLIVKDKSLEPAAAVSLFKAPQLTTMQILQNFFKNIFGN
jgi:hypothetical protein